MKYLTALIALILTSCAAVKVVPYKVMQSRPYPAVGVLYHDERSICTLTLIDESVVLTAAHCVNAPGSYTVRFGSDLYSVTNITMHPTFDDDWKGDIALLTIDGSPPIVPIPYAQTPVTIDDSFKRVVIIGRASSFLRWTGRWIIGTLKGSDMILWPDPDRWMLFGDSGGPLIWDDCVGGITRGFLYDSASWPPWRVGISTDVGIFTEWIDDYLRESDL